MEIIFIIFNHEPRRIHGPELYVVQGFNERLLVAKQGYLDCIYPQ